MNRGGPPTGEAACVTLRSPDPVRDFDEVLALVQACDRVVLEDSDWTESGLREEWKEIDLQRDAWVAEVDGRIAGVMHLYDTTGGRMDADGYVHPELTGRGVGSLLLEAVERRALDFAHRVHDGGGLVVRSAHLAGDDLAPRLFVGRGYARVRTFFRMVVRLDDEAPPAAVAPDGIEMRPLDVARHGELAHAATQEAFAQEWAFQPRPYDEWARRTLGGDAFDPALCVIAWDGDEIAGVALNAEKRNGDWGWVNILAVRAPWRRRGLGEALLRDTFRRFHERGERVVALGVDSENPTGATRLYERVGMRMLWSAHVWEKAVDR